MFLLRHLQLALFECLSFSLGLSLVVSTLASCLMSTTPHSAFLPFVTVPPILPLTVPLCHSSQCLYTTPHSACLPPLTVPLYHSSQCLSTPLSASLPRSVHFYPQVTAELERTIGANQSTAAVQVQDSQTSASEALTKQQSRMQTQIDQLKKDVTLAEDLTESVRHEVSIQSDPSFSSEIMCDSL